MNEAPPRRSIVGYLLVSTAAICWGFWPYFLRNAESRGGVDSALESVIAMGLLGLVSAALVRADRVRVRADRRAWLGIGWLAVGDALNVLFFFRAYQTTTVAIAVLSHYLAPIFIAVAAPLVLGERADRRTSLAVLISFSGLVFLLEPWRSHASPSLALGATFGAASAFFYASNVLVTKRLVPVFSGSEMTFYHSLLATPLLALMVPHGAWQAVDAHALHWLLAGSLICGAFPGLFFVWGLRSIAASRAATLTLLEPLVAVLVVGVFLFGERLNFFGIVGGSFILTGAVLVLSRSSRQSSNEPILGNTASSTTPAQINDE
ncbi:MAG: DMT family transporter [Polyangiaceae bacterium]